MAHEMMNMVIIRLTCDVKPFSSLAISITLIVVFQYVTEQYFFVGHSIKGTWYLKLV